MTKDLYKVALLSSTLVLVGCGGNNGDDSSTSMANVNTTLQNQLDQTRRQLVEITNLEVKNQIELAAAEKTLMEKKAIVDAFQSSPTATSAEMQAAQKQYNLAAADVSKLKAEAAEIQRKKAVLKEKVDTVSVKAASANALSSLVTKLFEGTLTTPDALNSIKGINELSSKELLPYAKNVITEMSSKLESRQSVKAAVEGLLNLPMITDLFIPFIVDSTQMLAKEHLASQRIVASPHDGVTLSTINDTQVDAKIDVKALVKKATGVNILYNPYMPNDIRAVYAKLNFFIDDHFKKYSQEFPTVLNAALDVNNPQQFQTYLLEQWPKFKSVASKIIDNFPDAELQGGLAVFKQKLQSAASKLTEEDMDSLKEIVAMLSDSLFALKGKGLSAEAPVSASAATSYRKARTGRGGVELNHLSFNGNALNQSYALDIPLRIDLKGVLTSSKTWDVVGSVTYTMNGTVLGMVQSYNNTVDLHAETSVLLSQSLGNFFIEAQAGYVGVREGQFSGWEGQRYQATLGYDAVSISPFVQLEYRPLSDGLSTLDTTGVYIGLESDLVAIECPEATFTSTLLAKVGYESTREIMLGQYLHPNQRAAAFIEWNAGLRLPQGFEVKSALTLGTQDQSVKLNIAFEQ